MQKLVSQHRELLNTSLKKTDLIKDGNTDELARLLMRERKQTQMIEQTEIERQHFINEVFAKDLPSTETSSVSTIITLIDDSKLRDDIEETVTKLIEVIIAIQQNEELNKDLIQQSLQFVQLSLDMLQPTTANLNYDGKNRPKDHGSKRSVFDSKI